MMIPLTKHTAINVWPLSSQLSYGLVAVIGYTIFRLSNLEKNEFRKDPNNPRLARKSSESFNTSMTLADASIAPSY